MHNTKALKCGRVIDRFPEIVARLKGMLERFLTTLDCVDVAFVADRTLDELPLPAHFGRTRVSGVDLNKPRLRAGIAAAVALGPCPSGFSASQFLAKVQAMTGQSERDYSLRQAAYDLKKLRAKSLIAKLPASRRYQAPPDGLRTMAALLLLREHVIKPLLAGVNASQEAHAPKLPNAIDLDYERLLLGMHALFQHLGFAA